MVQLQIAANLAEGPAPLMTGLRSPVLIGQSLYVTSAARGGLLALDAKDLSIRDQIGFQMAQSGLGAERQLLQIAPNALIATGQRNAGLELFTLSETGQFSAAKILRASNFPRAVETIDVFHQDGQTFLLVSSRLDAGLSLWTFDAAKGISLVKLDLLSQNEPADLAQALALPLGNKTLMLTLSAKDNQLKSHWLGADGGLQEISHLGAEEGLYTSGLNSLKALTIGGQNYLLLGASGSSSIVVVKLGADGKLELSDHIIDDLHSRFGTLQALDVVEAGEQTYVLAAGTDLGLSLFTLLPDGKLVMIESLAGGEASALNVVTGIESRWNGQALEIFVTGTSSAGVAGSALSKINYEIGPDPKLHMVAKGATFTAGEGNDIVIASDGGTRMEGGAGDDILVDGLGPDTLQGGAGRDLFVLRPDAYDDVILDFNPAQDRLDLSQLGSFYTLGSMGFKSTATGAELQIAGHKILLYSHDGKAITAQDLPTEKLRGPSHIAITPWSEEEPPQPPKDPDPPVVTPPVVNPPVVEPPIIEPPKEPSDPQLLFGTPKPDQLRGGSGNDTLIGMGGADQLFGSGGDDLLIGASLYPSQEEGLAQIYRLYQAALNRAPDEIGLISWNHLINAGKNTITQTATGFIKSGEFLRTYGETSTGDYITLLYNNVLGRDPDAGGFRNWTVQMEKAGMSREAVLLGFSDSAENIARTKIGAMSFGLEGLQAYSIPEAFRFYVATLNRTPDLPGLLDWSSQLAAGRNVAEIANGFIASAEFKRNYGETKGSEFITLIYRNILGREPDASGLFNWTNHLAATNRNQVVLDMMKSKEFLNKTAPMIKDWIKALGVDDYLEGGSGTNHLYGGLFRDHFAFSAKESSSNTLYRLEPWDLVELKDFGYRDKSDFASHLVNTSRGALFADAGVSILFANAYAHDVLAADFIF